MYFSVYPDDDSDIARWNSGPVSFSVADTILAVAWILSVTPTRDFVC